jgi:small redox-active disulfide protein 2
MKKLQILGTGCAKCAKLFETTQNAAKSLGMDCSIEKVTDLQEIMKFGVMMTPALVVDGVVKVSGKIPAVEEVKKMIAG